MQKLDVFVCVELRHLSLCCRFRSLFKEERRDGKRQRVLLSRSGFVSTHENLHVLVQAVVHNEGVAHPNSGRLHRMTWAIMVVANVGIEEVTNS